MSIYKVTCNENVTLQKYALTFIHCDCQCIITSLPTCFKLMLF